MQTSSFHDSIALRFDYAAQQFAVVPLRDLTWTLDDAATLYGAILVERFRTYGSKLLDLSDYCSRLAFGAGQLAITLPIEVANLTNNASRLLELNASLLQGHRDVSVVMLVSPGVPSLEYPMGTRPTCMMHLSELPFGRLNDWYKNGTPLVLASHNTVPTTCWPSQMKTRSRLPYLLADTAVSAAQTNSLALLTTARGTIADTSVANVLMIDKSDRIVSPPKEDVLVGCTLLAIEKLLKKENVTITYRNIDPAELLDAAEVILTGSSGGVWSAGSIDGHSIGQEANRPRYFRLRELWKEYAGIDFVAQAAQTT